MDRSRRPSSRRVTVETLQNRLLFAIEMDLVALHEFGHALGLAHYANTSADSIMEAYYNANYNKAGLASDVAVTVNAGDNYNNLMELFSDARVAANGTSWKDSLDGNPGNGTVNVTFSYMPDGSRLDNNKRNALFSTMNAIFGSASAWQPIFAEELNRWASVSSGNLSFTQVADNGANFAASGAAQNDARFGDIRIGAHRFDGAGGVLAHTYYPPPNGGTAAGDAHFATEETWVDGAPRIGTFVRQADGRYFCTVGEHQDHDHEYETAPVAAAAALPSVDQPAAPATGLAGATPSLGIGTLDNIDRAVDFDPATAV